MACNSGKINRYIVKPLAKGPIRAVFADYGMMYESADFTGREEGESDQGFNFFIFFDQSYEIWTLAS